jgi:uncharacterized membrane protein
MAYPSMKLLEWRKTLPEAKSKRTFFEEEGLTDPDDVDEEEIKEKDRRKRVQRNAMN